MHVKQVILRAEHRLHRSTGNREQSTRYPFTVRTIERRPGAPLPDKGDQPPPSPRPVAARERLVPQTSRRKSPTGLERERDWASCIKIGSILKNEKVMAHENSRATLHGAIGCVVSG
ncbi:LOW QUALITY PROTEIN: uncharacterized protein [Bombus fervidus]|uniref:LOW QUALITY PROTEIN: uncharacterized protein n=1 Tax=Bombus fervidus TaxID=203811 RepID=UPI003AB73E61